MILNRDVQLRVAPNAEAAVVRTLSKGQTVSFLGSPRRTGFALIGRGGQSLGYVPLDSLDPLWGARTAEETVALVDGRFVDRDGRLAGTHVVGRAIGSGKQAFPRGSVVKVESVDGRSVHVSAGAGKATKVPVDALQPIIGVRQGYPGISGEAPSFFLSKLGEYPSPAEANAAWSGELAFVAERQPQGTLFVYPSVQGGKLTYGAASGPFARADAEALCIYAARRGRDCSLVQVDLY